MTVEEVEGTLLVAEEWTSFWMQYMRHCWERWWLQRRQRQWRSKKRGKGGCVAGEDVTMAAMVAGGGNNEGISGGNKLGGM